MKLYKTTFLAALFLVTACAGSAKVGEECSSDADCEDGLECHMHDGEEDHGECEEHDEDETGEE